MQSQYFGLEYFSSRTICGNADAVVHAGSERLWWRGKYYSFVESSIRFLILNNKDYLQKYTVFVCSDLHSVIHSGER